MPLLNACAGFNDRAKPHLWEATIDVSALTEDGQTLVTPNGGLDGAPILIVRKSFERFGALSMLCTHEGCPVNPPVGGRINCPCHGSQFGLDGRVLRGPALLSLARYTATYNAKAKRLAVSVDA